jgi:hypothetical protein
MSVGKGSNYYFCRMTDQELVAYFKDKILPETLRINRAITQHNVREQVDKNIEMMLANPKEDHSRHRLNQIAEAIENPYAGTGIPNL